MDEGARKGRGLLMHDFRDNQSNLNMRSHMIIHTSLLRGTGILWDTVKHAGTERHNLQSE